jgi:ribosomal protein S18 acetylase RimI-like enzyme
VTKAVDALRFRAQTLEEYTAYRAAATKLYGAQMVEFGGMPEEQAYAKARDDIDALLPEGELLPNHVIIVGVEHEQPVGLVWLGSRRDGIHGLWIFDIAVEERHRGRGFGRALMLEAERHTREAGGGSLALNVFGGNVAAISLYDSLGYTVDAQQMSKDLDAS